MKCGRYCVLSDVLAVSQNLCVQINIAMGWGRKSLAVGALCVQCRGFWVLALGLQQRGGDFAGKGGDLSHQ